jgi:L-threonylcarbamoyladenylate synthase
LLETSKYESLELAAQELFDRLRQFDEEGASIIIVEMVTEEGIGLAIMNRLRKAASEAEVVVC